MSRNLVCRPGIIVAALLVLGGISCHTGKEKANSDADTEKLRAMGDSLAVLAQKTLLQNVSAAIQQGGAAYAVEFCNLKAMPLTDSVGSRHGVVIGRVTDKARNSANMLSGERETALFGQVRDSLRDGKIRPHYLLDDVNGRAVYYKPIILGMPTCLQCHGIPGQDIAPETLQKIKEKYPSDAATGYTLGELRGMWKITLASSAGE